MIKITHSAANYPDVYPLNAWNIFINVFHEDVLPKQCVYCTYRARNVADWNWNWTHNLPSYRLLRVNCSYCDKVAWSAT